MVTKEDIEMVTKLLSTPSGYASLKLKMKLHPKQKLVLDNIFNTSKSKVILRTANGIGKTSIIITAAILYALEMLNAQVISTSATYRQVVTQLIPCLKQYSHLYPRWRFLDNSISINGISRYIGFSTDDESTAQGFHDKPGMPLLMIVDEAAGVKDTIFGAFMERCDPSYLLIVGSPLGAEGMFYKIETDANFMKQFKHYTITALECTKSKGYWLDDNSINTRITNWGRMHPLVLSSIFAQFSSNTENGIISLSAIERCINNPPTFKPGVRRVGIDFAAGGDQNAIALRQGNRVSIIKKWRNKDTMSAVGEMVIELNKLKVSIGLLPNEVYGDASGLGLPMIDRLRELGWDIHHFFGQSKAQDDNYRYKITECWIAGCKKIENCEVVLPNDIELKGQLLSRKQKLNSSGKMELESKKDMMSRGVESPDIADAVLMAMDDGSQGAITSAHGFSMELKQHSFV